VIVGAAVCPGAPFLVDGTADAVADRLATLVVACRDAVRRLPECELVLLVTAAAVPARGSDRDGDTTHDRPAFRVLSPGSVISAAPLRRSDLPVARPVRLSDRNDRGLDQVFREIAASGSPDPRSAGRSRVAGLDGAVGAGTIVGPSVGTIVGAYLIAIGAAQSAPPLAHRGAGGATFEHSRGPVTPRTAPPATVAVEVVNPDVTADLLSRIVLGPEWVAVLVIGDGAACHGDDAPGRRDDRSAAFDAALADALGAGDPAALLAACTPVGVTAAELLATVAPLQVLGRLALEAPPIRAALLYHDAPLGVGYLFASWSWVAS